MGPHRLMMFCLELAGMMSITGGPLLKTYSYYIFISFFVFGSSLSLFAFQQPQPIMKKLQTMHYLIALIQIFFKFLSIFRYQPMVFNILKTIQNLSIDAMQDQKNKEVLDRANRLSSRITKVFLFIFCGYYPIRLTNLLLKYLVLRRPPQLFLPGSWMPGFIEDNYVLSLFYQVLTSLCVGFTNASYSVFIIYLTLQISAQIQILRRMFEESLMLETCIALHQKLMRLFIQINSLLSGMMFVEIILTSFYSCVCSFLIIQGLSMGGKEVGNHVHVLLLVLVRSFLICYCGNVIIIQGEKLHNSVYFANWSEQGRKYRQSLPFIMMLTTTQPFKYNYRQVVTMDMAQFMKSMQTTYSYLTMLLSLTK